MGKVLLCNPAGNIGADSFLERGLTNGCGVTYAFRVAEPPRDTVSFLFTDVEGSTFLMRQLGEQVFVAHGGREIDTQGDSFFYAFGRARDANRGRRRCGAARARLTRLAE